VRANLFRLSSKTSHSKGPRRFRGGARGRARKNELLDAALRVLARDGGRRLTHRAVAEEAGAPLGLMTYYFGSTEDLLASAFGHLAQREIARMKAITASLSRGAAGVDEAADVIAHYVSDGLVMSRDFVVAGYELSVEAARREDLALLNRIWCGALEERLEHVLTDLGSENPSQHAQLVLAVVAGLEVNHMGDAGASFYSDVAQPLVRELFRALVPNPSVAPSP
jgi:TetR/AcrR family transcriptional regulator, regulator of biofilm formation and stress response